MSPPFGITFSHPHLEYLGLDVEEALQEALRFHFAHIRLAAYWDRIETARKKYNFSELKKILETCQKNQQAVVLTVGMKAPRWPEFYWPAQLSKKNPHNVGTQQAVLDFIRATVQELKTFTCITHWQVENEALDPSGPKAIWISKKFLRQEVALVRSLDKRPIINTVWGNDLWRREAFKESSKLSDIVGIDLYYKHFALEIFHHAFYAGLRISERKFQKILQKNPKPIWIMELQAEPWEKDAAAYRAENPASISPALLKKNFQRASRLPVEEILFWGFEYWFWRAKQGDQRYFDLIRELNK